MKRLFFRSEEAFLEKLDGKVYEVCDKQGHYLCDVIEEDYLRLIEAGILIDLDENRDYTLMEADCNCMLTLDLSKKEIMISLSGSACLSKLKENSRKSVSKNVLLTMK